MSAIGTNLSSTGELQELGSDALQALAQGAFVFWFVPNRDLLGLARLPVPRMTSAAARGLATAGLNVVQKSSEWFFDSTSHLNAE